MTMPDHPCGKNGPPMYGLDKLGCVLPAGHGGICQYNPAAVARVLSKPNERANYVAAPEFFALNQACVAINRALGDDGRCYLVGSALDRKDHRDVDVRFIMGDAAFDRLFRVDPRDVDGGGPGWLNPLWSLLCLTISVWLREQTGLPVDFQIQRRTQANEKHTGKRSALGIFLDYPGELPMDLKVDVAPSESKGEVGGG